MSLIADEQETSAAKRNKEEAAASHEGERGRSGYDQVPVERLLLDQTIEPHWNWLFYHVISNFAWINV